MLKQERITDALSQEFTVTPLTPADFQDVPYSPALLLPACFDSSITANKHQFREGCEGGFEAYFEDMYTWKNPDDQDEGLIFVSQFYTLADVKSFLLKELLPSVLSASFPYRVGFVLGWLSALALTNSLLAMQGVRIAESLVHNLVATGRRG